jgi:signal transduction histidine kinase
VRHVTKQRLQRRFEALRQQQLLERERGRIAQDLHDDLGAGLTEISLTSDMATNPSLPEYESRQYTREIGACARGLVQRMDEIVWAVNPRNDSVISLSVYASQYAQQFLKPMGIAVRLDVEPGLVEIPLNADQRYNFFLAFKEIINNIARHSGATELHLAIHSEDGELVFLINDNGRGFEPASELPGADGLRNIRERITRMGGKCEISGQPGRGTRVSIHVPLAAESAGTFRHT